MNGGIVVEQFGGPERLAWREIELPPPGDGEVLVAHTAIGLNFIDTYHRAGLYPLELPAGIGTEAAGKVVAVGSNVSEWTVGDRVAWLGLPPGTYAEQRVYRSGELIAIPSGIDDKVAAACLLKGLTAWYLLHHSYAVEAGDSVLLYAAAGGVGLIAAQWASSLGVRVIGVVSTDGKAELARAHGCADIVFANDANFVERVRGMTDGNGVAAVYDSVGRDTFYQSLDCLRPHGTMVTYGNASGPVEPFSPMELAKRGSLKLTRPAVFDFIRTPEERRSAAAALFNAIDSGAVTVRVNQTYALQDAAEAHRDLEARRTTGSSVLLP